MGDGVRGDEIFKAVEIFQDVFADHLVAHALGGVLQNLLHHFQEEGAGAGGEVQHRDAAAVGQAILNAKGVFSRYR